MTPKKLLVFSVMFFSLISNAQNYPDLYETIKDQLNNDVINIPHGTYTLDIKTKPNLFNFSDRKNLQINGNGSMIIGNYLGTAMKFTSCENVTISDMSIDFNPGSTTQGTITKISADKNTLEVKIHDGYQMIYNTSVVLSSILIYDKDTREYIRNYYTAHSTGAVVQDTISRTVTFSISMGSDAYKLGDYVTFKNDDKKNGEHLFVSQQCKDMKFNNINIYDCVGASFLERYCSNSLYYRCIIGRRTGNPLYSVDPLRSTTGDIVHSMFASKGPKIEECTFKYMDDDGINIGGFFYPVYKVNKARKRIYVLISQDVKWIFPVENNDTIVCVNNDGTLRGKSKITDISAPSAPPTQAEIDATLSKLTTLREKDILTIGKSIQLDEWIEGVNVGDMIYPEGRTGNGFEFVNNNIGHNRSRGILVKASNGKIHGNTISGCSMGGIVVAPEYFWGEGGVSHDVEIYNNLVENCAFDASMLTSGQCAGIAVVHEAPKGGLTQGTSFKNIRVYNNTVRGCPMPCVILNSIDTGYYYGNTIEPDENMIRYHGYNLGITNRLPLYEKYNSNIIKDIPQGIINTPESDNKIRIDQKGYITYTEANSNRNIRLTVYNIIGRPVLFDEFNQQSSVSLNFLGKGLYIINLNDDGKSYSRKYIVK
jgi:hypothetical protein